MSLKKIMEWFDKHHTLRKFISMMGITALGWFITNWAAITNNIPGEYQIIFVFLLAMLRATQNYLKHNTTGIPLVSKEVSKDKKVGM